MKAALTLTRASFELIALTLQRVNHEKAAEGLDHD